MTLATHECRVCSILFAAPAYFWSERERDQQTFYCPNGHASIFSETVETQLRKELEAKERRLQDVRRARDWAREDAEQEKRSHTATKGHLTRAKRRAAAAVCPVGGCHRTIQQMARHLRTVHPGYDPEG